MKEMHENCETERSEEDDIKQSLENVPVGKIHTGKFLQENLFNIPQLNFATNPNAMRGMKLRI